MFFFMKNLKIGVIIGSLWKVSFCQKAALPHNPCRAGIMSAEKWN
jgi:hypothetical protein